MDEIDDQVIAAFTSGIHAEITATALANFSKGRIEVVRARIASERNGLDTGVEILKLKLIGSSIPILQTDLITADKKPCQSAQDHLVRAHTLTQSAFDVIDRQVESLGLLSAHAHFLNMPLPADPSSEPRHQGQRHYQWQPRLTRMESGTIIHSTSSVPLHGSLSRGSESWIAQRFN